MINKTYLVLIIDNIFQVYLEIVQLSDYFK